MSRTVLVTGAQGFIGRYLVRHWLDAAPEDTVIGIGRSAGNATRFTHGITWGQERIPAPLPDDLAAAARDPRYRYEPVNLSAHDRLRAVLERYRPDVVVHLAGALRDEPAEHLFQSNVLGTETLLEVVGQVRGGATRVVLGSSGIIAADPSGDHLPVDDDRIGDPLDLYTVSKAATEHAARLTAARYEIPLIVARIFNVVGPGQDERHLCGWLAHQCAGILRGRAADELMVGPRHTTRDFIDVRDVATALRRVALDGVPGLRYNVATGVETAVDDVFRRFVELLGREVRVQELPARPRDVTRHFADIARLAGLGWRAEVTLQGSIEDTLRYYLALDAVRASERRARREDETLEVSVQHTAAYPVIVRAGLLADLPTILRHSFPDRRIVVLSDEHVGPLHGRDLLAGLSQLGVEAASVIVPQGERSKSFETCHDVIARMYEHRFDRRALLVNLGGGVVMDLGGFTASCYMRGVDYVNVPTTLLAQQDAAIGGKTAVNASWAKNFIGAFHHPRAVYCDPLALRTLPVREIAAGIAEVIKVAIINDPALFGLLEDEAEAILARRDPEVLNEVVLRAARGKIALLAGDPLERDLRRPLNLGHTFAHPLETRLGYRGLLHGEAVAVGIAVATALAEDTGVCPSGAADRIYALLRRFGLPPAIPLPELLAACEHVRAVRLVRGNHLHFVLPAGIGSVRIVPDVDEEALSRAVTRVAEHPLLAAPRAE